MLFLKDDMARGIVLAVVLLDGALLHYAETARGYSLQTFFVVGLLLSLLCLGRGEAGSRTFNAAMWLLCAFGCCLSVSSGVIYVTALTGLWCILYLPFRTGVRQVWLDGRHLFVAGAAFSVFVLLWYGGNYETFAQGRDEFGGSFLTAGQYLAYCGGILWDTRLALALPCLAFGAVWLRGKDAGRLCALCGGMVLLMLLSSLVTRGGPVRIFLPLVPAAFFGAGAVLDELFRTRKALKRYSFWLLILAAAGCVFLSENRRKAFSDPDLVAVFREISKLDPRIYVSYRPADIYVMRTLLGPVMQEDNYQRSR